MECEDLFTVTRLPQCLTVDSDLSVEVLFRVEPQYPNI